MRFNHIIFASGGNDSVALTQFAFEKGLKHVAVAYSNTGWAADFWPARMEKFQAVVGRLGFQFFEIPSEGMLNLVDRKQAWPANRPKFCTYELKILPAKKWMDGVDPDGDAICMTGVRREESAARAQWPEYQAESENHGGRDLWSPLVAHTEAMRDALILRAGLEILPHRSKECFPCVNANRQDLRMLAEYPERVQLIADKEAQSKRTMFRPHRFHGAVGIEQVIQWAKYSPGQYQAGQMELDCDSGMCGL
jgi:3'-phosphoadenosine 5'-phosphosulfate sulfotransferase (PAPS reductase)/FAD synthetase